ncbi:MAG: hypothetical protein PHE49_04945 [bacterium]|nr:hypothetical protein [bacterium]
MEYKNRHLYQTTNKELSKLSQLSWCLIIIILLLCIVELFPVCLYAIEGNEPEAKLELISPEIKQKELDTTKIVIPEHFFETYGEVKYGNTEYGKEYGLALGSKKIDKFFELKAEKVEDKSLIGGNIERNHIGSNNLTEFKTKAFVYNLNNEWYKNCMFDLNEEVVRGKNIFKTSGSLLYEKEVLWDAMVLLGRNIKEKIFIGAGVCMPYIAPAIQINWNVNDKLVINSIYNSKKVTNTNEDIYILHPYIKVIPNLLHENYLSTAKIEFLFVNNVNTTIEYKQVENKIYFCQINDFLEPVNLNFYKKLNKWNWNLSFMASKFRDTVSCEYIPTKPDYYFSSTPYFGRPKNFAIYSIPEFSGKNFLAISIPCGIELGIESKYMGKRDVYYSCPDYISPDYWLHNMVIAKEFRNIKVWGKISNLTNTKYEIIKGIDGYGASIEAGIKLSI